jgi:hypothetical protein
MVAQNSNTTAANNVRSAFTTGDIGEILDFPGTGNHSARFSA